ncbi:MAG: BPL-N domain-containing protein [Promethearchaeota archaeon]|jgi:glutamine amidotransferase-like uncharacterized protein
MPVFLRDAGAQGGEDLKNVKVAIYNNQGSDINLASRIALEHMFLWMGADVENISPINIRNGDLVGFDILAIPGRSDSTTFYELDTQGVSNILNFVRSGGSYFGICGGVHFAARNDVNLFLGTIAPVPGEIFSPHIVQMRINTQSTNPDLSALNETFSTLFWGSTYFVPDNPDQINSIAEYSNCNESGMISYRYGRGSVFLSSPHPEFEENNDRDGTSSFDSKNDLDSEWNLMLKVSSWLVKVTTTEAAVLWLISFSGGGIFVTLIVLIIKNRKS